MIYGYLRVSRDTSDENNQKTGVERKARQLGLRVGEYIVDHAVSGKKEPDKRELGTLLKKARSGDVIIASELSRLGRSLYMVMRVLEHCMKNNIRVLTVKDGYELGDNIQSKVLAFAFSLAAEIEWELTSQRIREALARKKKNGAILGRPIGSKSYQTKLSGKKKEIRVLRKQGISKSEIGRRFNVHRETVNTFMRANGIT